MEELTDPITIKAFIGCFAVGVVAMGLAHFVSTGHSGHRRHWIKLKHLTWLLPLAAVMCYSSSQAFNPKQRWSYELMLKQTGVSLGIASVFAWWPACIMRWGVFAIRNRIRKTAQNQTIAGKPGSG
jgi:hypothetical protein